MEELKSTEMCQVELDGVKEKPTEDTTFTTQKPAGAVSVKIEEEWKAGGEVGDSPSISSRASPPGPPRSPRRWLDNLDVGDLAW